MASDPSDPADASLAAAREAIRDLVARYNALGDAGRIEALVALFREDAVLETPLGACHGRDAIRALFEDAAARTGRGGTAAFVQHHVATHVIELTGPDEARGRAYYQVLSDRGLDHWGRYRDRYRREGGVWRFAERRVRVDGRVPGGWADESLAGRAEP